MALTGPGRLSGWRLWAARAWRRAWLRSSLRAQLTLIVNTADDFHHYGLHISPDLDTVMYTLAGLSDPVRGWGLRDDSAHMLAALQRYGEAGWFQLGDQDLATHLLRTHWLAQGQRLTEVTARLAAALGLRCALLPMSDDPVATQSVDQGGGRAGLPDLVRAQALAAGRTFPAPGRH